MSIIVFKCNVCNREISKPENPFGLETVGRCIITSGCRGSLNIIDRKQDHIRGSLPKIVEGLADWTQRNMLYTHKQITTLTKWTVSHNLGVNPIITVLVNRPTPIPPGTDLTSIELTDFQELVVSTDFVQTIVDPNTFTIEFTKNEFGVVNCVAKSSAPSLTSVPVVTTTSSTTKSVRQASVLNNVTIATLSTANPITLDVVFSSPDGVTQIPVQYSIDTSTSIDSPWSGTNSVLVFNKKYIVRDFNFKSAEYLAAGVPNKYTMDIISIDGVPMSKREVLILLADPPFHVFDKVDESYIDASSVVSGSNYVTDELYINESTISNIYPPIKKIG